MFWTYIIRSTQGYRYIGQTGDLVRRLSDHNTGRNHATKHGSNWKFLHIEQFETRSEAVKRERWLKSGVGRTWLEQNVAGWSSPQAK